MFKVYIYNKHPSASQHVFYVKSDSLVLFGSTRNYVLQPISYMDENHLPSTFMKNVAQGIADALNCMPSMDPTLTISAYFREKNISWRAL